MTAGELAEIRRLFRAKLGQLREQERPRAQRSTAPRRRRVRLDAVESPPSDTEVLSSNDVAQLFGVHTKTVSRWTAEAGLPSFRTLGGHRR